MPRKTRAQLHAELVASVTGVPVETVKPAGLSPELAALIGLADDEDAEPETQLDHALRWVARGLFVFPCQRFLGLPLPGRSWYTAASRTTNDIVEWWAERPNADIAAVPSRSGHFVIVGTGDTGRAGIAALEDEHGPFPAEFRYVNRWGDEHLWIKGKPQTSHHKLARDVHVLGQGHYVYLPPSLAPDPFWGRTTP